MVYTITYVSSTSPFPTSLPPHPPFPPVITTLLCVSVGYAHIFIGESSNFFPEKEFLKNGEDTEVTLTGPTL